MPVPEAPAAVRLRRLIGGLLPMAASLLCAWGCSAPPPPPPPAPPGVGACGDIGFATNNAGGRNNGLRTQVFIEGPVELELEPFTYGLCSPDLDYPRITDVSAARLEVPEVPVEFEVSTGLRQSTVVHLANASAGTYRLLRTVTPDPRAGKPTGTFESTFHVAEDRRDGGLEVLPFECSRLDRSTQGTWLCDHRVLRDGVLLEELPEDWSYVVSGSVIWGVSRDERQVARWLDLGSGPLERQTVTGPEDAGVVTSGEPALVASEQELLVRRHQEVEHYLVPSDGGTAGWVSTSEAPPGRFLVRMGQQLLLDDETRLPSAENAFPNVCPYGLDASGLQRTELPCVRASDFLAGADEEGLWSYEDGLVLYAPSDGGVQVSHELPFLFGLSPLGVLHGATRASPGYRLNEVGTGVEGQHLCATLSEADGQPRRLELFEGQGPLLGIRRSLLWGKVDEAATPSTWVIAR